MAYRLWCGGLPSWLVHEDVKLWAFGNSGVWPANVQLVRKCNGETKISAFLGYHKQQEAKVVLERLSGVPCQGFRVSLKVSKDSEEKMKAHVNAKEPEEEHEKANSGVAQAVVANEAGNSQERQEQPVVVPAASSSPTKQEASVPAPAEPPIVEAAEQQEVSGPVQGCSPVVEAAEQQEVSVPAPPEPPIVGTEVPVPPQPLIESKIFRYVRPQNLLRADLVAHRTEQSTSNCFGPRPGNRRNSGCHEGVDCCEGRNSGDQEGIVNRTSAPMDVSLVSPLRVKKIARCWNSYLLLHMPGSFLVTCGKQYPPK